MAEAITIVILGSLCGLKNVSQIHQWAASDRVSEFLKEKFKIELGMTFAQKSVSGKNNEIAAVQELIGEPEISGCIIVANALNCQKKTAEEVIKGNADYLLCAKDNQENLQKDIEAYVQDKSLQTGMKKKIKKEKNRGRSLFTLLSFPMLKKQFIKLIQFFPRPYS